MQQNSFKLTTGSYLGILFFVLMFAAIFMKDTIFDLIISQTGADTAQQSQQATQKTTDLLLSLDKIKLNTAVLESSYLQSLTTLPSFPVDFQTLSNFGKANPFVGNFIIVPTKASSTVGAVIYSNQRAANNGRSVLPVSTSRR